MSPDDLRPGDVVPRRVIDPDDLEPGMVVEWQRSRPTFEGQDPNPSRRVSRPHPRRFLSVVEDVREDAVLMTLTRVLNLPERRRDAWIRKDRLARVFLIARWTRRG